MFIHPLSQILTRLRKSYDIQRLLDDGWTIETETLINSLEFLYVENYRMAIFNAVTILELVAKDFWARKKEQLNDGSRKDKEMAERLQRQIRNSKRKSGRGSRFEEFIRIVLPPFIDQDLIDSGCLDRCVEAWNIRNERLAHLYENVKSGGSIDVTSAEAWSAVASIINLVDNVKKAL